MALLPLAAALCACDDFSSGPSGQGELRWILDGKTDVFTRASSEFPDTNDFLLKVSDSRGKVLYEGPYGESPESLLVDAGSYTVCVQSVAFTAPAFSKPMYGDEQVVVVKAGDSVTVKLTCTLRNAGIRLRIAPDFLTSYPDGVLYLKSGDTRLMYSYSEKRIAYFKPGQVSLLLNDRGQEQVLLTRTLAAQEILSLSISAPYGGKAGSSVISVAVDTTKHWSSDLLVIGGDGGTSEGPLHGDDTEEVTSSAISVGEAASHVNEDIWLYGYIVGGDLTSAGATVKTSKITKNTHLAIAARASVTAKSSCIAVELPKGSLRDEINLVDHPDLIGSRIYIKGKVVNAYFGTTGLKYVSDYILK